MSRSRPYHRWVRVQPGGHSNTGISAFTHNAYVYPLANLSAPNQPDDIVERVMLDVTVACLLRPTSADVTWVNDWPMDATWEVCAAVESIGSGVWPIPYDQFGPTSNIVLTGALNLSATGVGYAPDFGHLSEPWAVWTGSFNSEGIRSSPLAGVGPAVQVTMSGGSPSGMMDPLSGGPESHIWIKAYTRALFASRVPF